MSVQTKAIEPTGFAERDRAVAALRRQTTKLRALGITRLSLFGSVARGEIDTRSDIDLLIEIDPESHFSLFELLDLQEDLRALVGRRVHFAFSSKLRPWLREEMLKEAIPIY